MTGSPHPHPVRSVLRAARPALLAFAALPLTLLGQKPGPEYAPKTPADQTVQLSPFEVTSEETQGYAALNSNSLTEFNTALKKLPVSADVFDAQFMQDIGSSSIEDMIDDYSAGAGINLANAGGSAGNTEPGDRNGNTFVSLRGLTAPTMQLDGLMPLNTFFNSGATGTGFTSNFNIERVDVVMGPQALLYGVGGAGGVINLVTKRAYFDRPTFVSDQFRVDQYGHKMNLFDFGAGSDKVGIRIALTDEQRGGRRVGIGGPLEGQYGQLAFRLPHNTVLRIEGTQTDYRNDVSSTGTGFSALNSKVDVRSGQSLRYLLATGQLQAAAGGAPSAGGYIGGGTINWNNVDSYAGNLYNEETLDTYELASLDTKWNEWLSTRVMAGYRAETNLEMGGGVTWTAADASQNPLGVEAIEKGSLSGLYEPLREKVFRVSVALTNDLFGGRAHSMTVIGGDYTRADGDVITYRYVAADSNFNPVLTGNAANNGYTFMPNLYVPAGAAPSAYPVGWGPGQRTIVYGGQNYTLVLPNDTVASLVGPGNPLGLSGHGSGDHRIGREINKGIYIANTTDWLRGRLTTLEGVRVADSLEVNQLETGFPTSGDLVAGGSPTNQNHGILSFNFGANYALLPWLRPYAQVSDSDDPPAVLSANPVGEAPDIARGIGEEAGVKFAPTNQVVSGSIAYFHTASHNEQYSFTSTLTNDINPSGINGRFGAVSNFINADRDTEGVQIDLTSNPTPNWRSRLAASFEHATISTRAVFPQLYNDQFYTNAAGDVTYQNGDLVYVEQNTFNSKVPVVPAGTAGAVPLTVAMMNDPSATNLYYADPAPVNSQVRGDVATVLKATEPGTGSPIRTGATGLPISALQIVPNAISPPPGAITVAEPGDLATGYPEFNVIFTSMYTFSHGPLDGFGLGGTFHAYWRYHDYYFYPIGVGSPSNPRIMYNRPPLDWFDAIFTYRRKFGRFELLSQLNIDNVFNHYHVEFLPNAVTGYSDPSNAFGVTFDREPRSYVWSNTIRF